MTYFVDTEEERDGLDLPRPNAIGAELAWQRRQTHGDPVTDQYYVIPVPVPLAPSDPIAVIQDLDFAPSYGAVINASDQTVYVWLSARGRTGQIEDMFDLQIPPQGNVTFSWPPEYARSKKLGYAILGGETSPTGKVTFYVSHVPIVLDVGSLTDGTATTQIPFVGAIAADGAHAHDVTLTIAQGTKSLVLANDSTAAGQLGINYYTTNEVDPATGNPIFPNPLPDGTGTTDATNAGGPFLILPGQPYALAVDLSTRGILVSNPDGANAADYRVWAIN